VARNSCGRWMGGAICNICRVLRRALSIKRGLRAKRLAGITNSSMRQRRRWGEMHSDSVYTVAENVMREYEEDDIMIGDDEDDVD